MQGVSLDESFLHTPRRDEEALKLLYDQLSFIFGDSFAPVIDYEFKEELGVDFYDALRTSPTEAVEVLRKLFKGEKTVQLIVGTLAERLRDLKMVPESKKLLSMLESVDCVGSPADR
jgi:hypothetical protein